MPIQGGRNKDYANLSREKHYKILGLKPELANEAAMALNNDTTNTATSKLPAPNAANNSRVISSTNQHSRVTSQR